MVSCICPPSCLVVDCAEMTYVGGRGSDDYIHRIVDDGSFFRMTRQSKKVNILGSMCCKCPSNPLSQYISIAV